MISAGWRELGMEFGLAPGKQHNLKRAFLKLGNRRAVNLGLAAIAGGVLHFEGAAATQLDSVMESFSRSESVFSEAGARIVHFEQFDGRSGLILYGCVHVIRMAAGSGHQR